MAWASVTGSGVQSSTSQSSWVLFGNQTVAVGERMILVIATDNRTTTDGNTNDHTAVASDGEGSWTKLREFTNGQGAAAAGACVSVWVSPAMTGTQVNNVTVTYSGAIAKQAASYHRFTTSASATVSSVGTPQDLANDGADPGSMTLGSLASAEHLWVRGIALETNSTTELTATSGWTVGGNGFLSATSGGGAAANMASRMEFVIATATTKTSDPTLASVDSASVLVALDETSSGNVTVTGVQASATATAQPGSPVVSLLGVQAAAPASASAGSPVVALLGVRAAATATAQPGTLIASSAPLGVVAQAPATAQPGSPVVSLLGVQAVATATARPGTLAVTGSGAIAQAPATASPGSPIVSILGVVAAATATAQPGSPKVSLLGVQAAAPATAQPGSPVVIVTGVQATATATAQPGTPSVGGGGGTDATVNGVRAAATATAQPGTVTVTLTAKRAEAYTEPAPAAPILDNFNRANEATLAGDGFWGKLDPVESGSLALTSNQVVNDSGAGYGKAYWLATTNYVNCEVQVTVATKNASGSIWVNLRLFQYGDAGGNWGGYEATMDNNGQATIDRVTNGGSTAIASTYPDDFATGPFAFSDGDKICLRAVGPYISFFHYHDGHWYRRLYVVDSTYTSGPVGIESQDGVGRIDDFAARALDLGSPTVIVTGVQASATATAQPGTPTTGNTMVVSGVVAQAPATAQPGTPIITATGVQAAATGTAQTGSPKVSLLGVVAQAPATAQPGSPAVIATGVRATATATAQPGTPQISGQQQDATVTGVRAAATATAQPGSPVVTASGDRALATATAQTGSPAVTVSGAQAAAPAAGQAGSPAVTVTGVQAVATATAQPGVPTVGGSVTVSGVRAAATATAQPGIIVINETLDGSRAAATATAQPGSPAIILGGAQAASTATALPGTLIATSTLTGVRAQATATAQPGSPAVSLLGIRANSVASTNTTASLAVTVSGQRALATATGLGGNFGLTIFVIGVRALAIATANPGFGGQAAAPPTTWRTETLTGRGRTRTATGSARTLVSVANGRTQAERV